MGAEEMRIDNEVSPEIVDGGHITDELRSLVEGTLDLTEGVQ